MLFFLLVACKQENENVINENIMQQKQDGIKQDEVKQDNLPPIRGGAYQLKEGYNMPNFVIETNKEKDFDLEKSNKPLFINFWTTWCDFCVTEMPDIQALYEEYKDKVDFLLVNSGENYETIEAFLVEQNGIYNFPVGYDEKQELTEILGLQGFPTTIVMNKNKIITDYIIGKRSKTQYKEAIEKVLQK